MPTDKNKTIRKLRALLSADVKGYSILMADDEIFTIKTIKEYRGIMSHCIEQHNGRVVDSPGDNILAEFASAVDAVQCAVEMQKLLKKENDRLVEDKRLEFRIGVNIGDVVQDDNRIYGDSVNIAARIEGLADPAGICVSRSAYDQIKKKLGFGFEYMGEHPVKNISEPVRVYKVLMDAENNRKLIGEKKKSPQLKWIFAALGTLIVITAGVIGVFYWKYFYLPTPENVDPENKMTFDLPKGPSIAVLPLDNMTGDPKQEFFCDGITENIISALSNIPNLFVISRNSTFTYKGKSTTAQQVGRELGAQYLLEGSIQKSTDNIRITIQLIETNTGYHKWSETFDRKLDDIFQLQDEITLSILKAINHNIKEGERLPGIHHGFKNLHAFLKFLKAIEHFNQVSPESNKMAQKELLKIIKSQPNIALVYAFLSSTYIMDLWTGSDETPLISFAKATEATRKALSLDENNPGALASAAYLSLMRKEHENAIAHVKKAISSQPNCSNCYALYGFILCFCSRPDEAISFVKKAILLNPFPPQWYYLVLGFAYIDSGQYDEAVKTLKQGIEIDPSWAAYYHLIRAYVHLGYDQETKAAVSEFLKLRPDFSLEKFLKLMPFKNQDQIIEHTEQIRKAGLPD